MVYLVTVYSFVWDVSGNYVQFRLRCYYTNTNLWDPLSLPDELLLLLLELDRDRDLSKDFECFFFLLRLLLVWDAGDEAGMDEVADFDFSNPSLLPESENCLEVPCVHLAPRLQSKQLQVEITIHIFNAKRQMSQCQHFWFEWIAIIWCINIYVFSFWKLFFWGAKCPKWWTNKSYPDQLHKDSGNTNGENKI